MSHNSALKRKGQAGPGTCLLFEVPRSGRGNCLTRI